jgi:hypothetical protein
VKAKTKLKREVKKAARKPVRKVKKVARRAWVLEERRVNVRTDSNGKRVVRERRRR